MVDREARNRLLRGIDDYMDEKITAAEFDALLHQTIAPHTEDKVIKNIDIWLCDSDEAIGTNRIVSVCSYWKFFNRCRLLLASDADYQTETLPYRLNFFGWLGMLAILAIVVLALLAFWFQSATVMLLCIATYILCGIVMFVSMWFTKAEPERNVMYAEYPFESFADLLAVRRSVPDFSSKRFPNKPPFPAPSQNRLIRFLWDTKCPAWVDRIGDTFIALLMWIAFLPLFIAISPILFLVWFTLKNKRQRFVLPKHYTTN
jgi:hypothetical protein